jgi:mono/diheme cytochrome c family protein
MNSLFKLGVATSSLFFASAIMFSCSPGPNDTGTEYAPQMYDDPAYNPLKQNESNVLNPGGLNMRVPAGGTIARGKLAYYNHIPKDSVEIAAARLKNPLRATQVNLDEGQVLYTRFCAPCHGAEGLGDGLVGQKFLGVANLTQDRLKEVPLGHIYHVITNGRGRMMPHGTQLNPEERWKITMYVRTGLQAVGEVEPDPATENVKNIDVQGASSDLNTNEVTGTTNPSGGATEKADSTKQLNLQED